MAVFVIAGHNKKAQGALGYDGITEHQRTTDLQRRVCSGSDLFLKSFGTAVNIRTDSEEKSNTEVIQWINSSAKKGDRGIDVHFNFNDPKASGVEVVVSPHTTEENKRRAIWLVNNIAFILGLKVRKREKGRDYIYPNETEVGKIGIIDKTNIPFMLLEVCFLNQNDLARYKGMEHIVAYAIRMAMVILDFTYEDSEFQQITYPFYAV